MDGDENTQNRDAARWWIQMSGDLSVEAVLAPHETKTLAAQVPPDYDFMFHRITCRSDGPVLLKFPVPAPAQPRLWGEQAVQSFSAALNAEYPAHLAALAGETLENQASHLVRFLAAGGGSPAVRAELRAIETKLDGLRAEWATIEKASAVPRLGYTQRGS